MPLRMAVVIMVRGTILEASRISSAVEISPLFGTQQFILLTHVSTGIRTNKGEDG